MLQVVAGTGGGKGAAGLGAEHGCGGCAHLEPRVVWRLVARAKHRTLRLRVGEIERLVPPRYAWVVSNAAIVSEGAGSG